MTFAVTPLASGTTGNSYWRCGERPSIRIPVQMFLTSRRIREESKLL